jgi:hypothetical protein
LFDGDALDDSPLDSQMIFHQFIDRPDVWKQVTSLLR